MDYDHLEDYWYPFAIFAVVFGVGCAGALLRGEWMWAFGTYTAATFFRLVAGSAMNRMGEADTVNAWNNKYHRVVVIALNFGVGVVLLGRLAYDAYAHNTHAVPFVLLSAAFVAYFIAAEFTAPNTFGARVRSATLTVVLMVTMAHLAWNGYGWGWFVLYGACVMIPVWFRLRALQRRSGWANR